jgi:hypothetical protein
MGDALGLRFGAPLDLANTLGSQPTFGVQNLSHAGHNVYGIAWIFRAKEAATITHLGFAYAQRIGTPPTYRISLQGVDETVTPSKPSGTILGGGSPASATFTPPADATWNDTFQWISLSNSIALTRGQLCAVVIDHSSGTIDGSNFSQFYSRHVNADTTVFPYTAVASAAGPATWAADVGVPLFGYKSSSKSYGLPAKSHTATSFSSNSTPDEYALAFTIPSSWCSTFTVMGVRAALVGPNSGKSTKAILYTGTTVLQEVTWDSDSSRANGNSGSIVELFFTDTTLSTLTAGSLYRLSFQPQDTSNSVAVPTVDFTSAQDAAAPLGGANCYLSTRTDAGAWSDDTTKRPMIEVILGDMTGGGGGGEVAYPFA